VVAANQQYLPVPKPATKPLTGTDAEKPSNEFKAASFYTYDQNFDNLDDGSKRESIYALLDVLPKVADMRYVTPDAP
jgi:hypothetical protein